MFSPAQHLEPGGGSQGFYLFKVGLDGTKISWGHSLKGCYFPTCALETRSSSSTEMEMVSRRFIPQRLKVTFSCKKLTPGLLPVILLDEKDDFLNDAREVFRADVNQEQGLVRKLLPPPALQLLRTY